MQKIEESGFSYHLGKHVENVLLHRGVRTILTKPLLTFSKTFVALKTTPTSSDLFLNSLGVQRDTKVLNLLTKINCRLECI